MCLARAQKGGSDCCAPLTSTILHTTAREGSKDLGSGYEKIEKEASSLPSDFAIQIPPYPKVDRFSRVYLRCRNWIDRILIHFRGLITILQTDKSS